MTKPFDQTFLGQALIEFSARDFSDWLSAGIRGFLGLSTAMPAASPADYFPHAKLYIGQNEFDLSADLFDVYQDLPSLAQVQFQRGLTLNWSELDFDKLADFAVAEQLIRIACRIRAKGLLDVLAGANNKFQTFGLEAFALRIADLRSQMLRAAVELCTGTPQAVRCLHVMMTRQGRPPYEVFAREGEALEAVLSLCRKQPEMSRIWLAIFSDALLRELDAPDASVVAESMRRDLVATLGMQEFNHLVDSIRLAGGAEGDNDIILLTSSCWLSAVSLVNRIAPPLVSFAARTADATGAMDENEVRNIVGL